jgi:hypothetical protein
MSLTHYSSFVSDLPEFLSKLTFFFSEIRNEQTLNIAIGTKVIVKSIVN